MRLVYVAVLGHLEDLARARGLYAALRALLEHADRILDRLGYHEKQLRGKLLGQAHQPCAHLIGPAGGEVRVQKLLDIREALGVEGKIRALELALHAVVLAHHHDDEALFIHGDELEALDACLAPPARHAVNGVIDNGGHHLPRPRDHAVRAAELTFELLVDLLRFRFGNLALFHQFVDVQPVALRGRDSSGGGVRLLKIAHFDQIRKLVADGRGAHRTAHLLSQRLGADRLGRGDVIFDHALENLLFALRQIHTPRSFLSFSTPFL